MEDASEDVAEDVVMADTGSNQVFSPAKTMEKVPSNITAEIEDIVMILQEAADKPDEVEDVEDNTEIEFQVVGSFTAVGMVEKTKKNSL
ncbi:uncharacterized protein TRUGW13939_07271 [Talaromyces rugulosus]|uniref:Uncharacterized protein n=1 Tax=Talaromyces rugulosus TaxID=121627 RepID=A0A7H8R299_TALRU|nr:uncharacterized protein TRUGW13939_07271 [Talaromyces rugulosus]QKX60128.1 hypothetical protein TRUGW13939_07271 [Talaromyces rugulosus]